MMLAWLRSSLATTSPGRTSAGIVAVFAAKPLGKVSTASTSSRSASAASSASWAAEWPLTSGLAPAPKPSAHAAFDAALVSRTSPA
jgi:hypothetical protein